MNKLIDMEYWLFQYIYATEVRDDGTVYFIRQQVGAIDGISFHLYANDHNPPHFHVKTKDGRIDTAFTLIDCSYLHGKQVSGKDERRIYQFWTDHKDRFEEFWKTKVKQHR